MPPGTSDVAGVPDPTGAVVLTGGAGSRLGGVDKAMVEVGGRTLLARGLDALDAVLGPGDPVVVVGPDVPGRTCVREEPAGGGPVAGLAAGLAACPAERVLVLAGDLPFVTAEALATLLLALDRHATADGVLAVDDTGRRQFLLGAWHRAPLAAALAALPTLGGARLRDLLAGLRVEEVTLVGHPPPWFDCDTPDALRQARSWA